MESSSFIMKVLLFLPFFLQLSSAEPHLLQVFYTGITPGTSFPEFTAAYLVDGDQLGSYDSTSRNLTATTEWTKILTPAADQNFWNRYSQMLQDEQKFFKADIADLMQLFNQTAGLHTKQLMYHCELNDDNTTKGYMDVGFDGEDFIRLDIKTLEWTAVSDQAELFKQKWLADSTCAWIKHNLETEFIPALRKFVSYGREILERKDPPEASLFQKLSSPPELVCHATGFFPKDITMSWQKNGEDVDEDVELLKTLPNNDGSFQKRIILSVSPEELQKHDYTCVIQHSSMKEDLVLKASERPILNGPDGVPIGIIVGVVVGLIVLVLCAAGILLWKKKRSDSRPAPSRAGSEGDSGSSGSERSWC